MKSHSQFIGIIIIVLAFAGYAVGQPAPLAGFDEYAERARRDWEVPGMAIAVVKDDKIVFAKGYGVKKAGEAAPVDANTLFAIGSSSKAFTAAAIAILVDGGNSSGTTASRSICRSSKPTTHTSLASLRSAIF